MKRGKGKAEQKSNHNGANLGFESKLWQAADKMRGNIDAAEYKHIVLGLIFLKYISDSFLERFHQLQNEKIRGPGRAGRIRPGQYFLGS